MQTPTHRHTPALRFPEFSDNWEMKKLGEEIQDSGYGPRFNGDDYSDIGNVKTIRGTDISLDGEILYEQVPLALLDEVFIKNHILEDGDLVVITTADCGLTGIFKKQNINYIPSAYAVRLRLKKTSNPYLFKYFFQTKLAKNQVDKFIRKATVANLPGSDILKFDIFLPTLPEQTKIGNFLTAVDTKIQGLRKEKALLEQYKKGMMQRIFSQTLRFKDADNQDFPAWEVKKLGEVMTIKKGEQLNKSDLTEVGTYPCINGGVLPSGYTDKFNTEANSIIMSEGGNSCGYINFIKTKFWSGGHCYVLSAINKIYDTKFMYQVLKNYETEIMSLRVGSGLPNIQMKDIRNFDIYITPTLAEQTKIANFLSAIDEKIRNCAERLEKMEAWKKGLLQQMFV